MKKSTPLVIAGTIGATLLALSQIKTTPKPTAQRAARAAAVETCAFEVDANGYILGGIVIPANWTVEDARKHCQATNSYILYKSDSGKPQPGRGWKWDGTKVTPPQPYKTWTLDEQTVKWIPDVAKPPDTATEHYGYVVPDEVKGETKGHWTADPTKVSPKETSPPLPSETRPSEPQKLTLAKDGYRFYIAQRFYYRSVYCSTTIEYFLVGGGGGSGENHGGAGGGGDVTTGSYSATVTAKTIVIGAGGAAGTSNGSDTTATGLTTALGGGLGGDGEGSAGATGGSGGGGGGANFGTAFNGAAGSGSNATAGGNGFKGSGAGTGKGGGGGGATVAGANGSGTGNGGNGLTTGLWTTSNAASTLAGGGGGGCGASTSPGTGGTGGGGAGGASSVAGTAGGANTGGGAGGGGENGAVGAAGGSGKAGFRCDIGVLTVTGGTASNDGSKDVWLFTASGTFDVTAVSGGVNHAPDFFQLFPMNLNDYVYDKNALTFCVCA